MIPEARVNKPILKMGKMGAIFFKVSRWWTGGRDPLPQLSEAKDLGKGRLTCGIHQRPSTAWQGHGHEAARSGVRGRDGRCPQG